MTQGLNIQKTIRPKRPNRRIVAVVVVVVVVVVYSHNSSRNTL